MLRWDIYKRVLMNGSDVATVENTKEDSKITSKLVWLTMIGNTIEDAVILSAREGFDPDDEIPLVAIRVSSDDGDMLYHTALSEVMRPGYATDCALINAAVDRDAILNDPPLLIVDGMHSVKDFTMKTGQRWRVRSRDAITPMQVPNTVMQTVQLREQVREESKQALATDSTKVGEFAGARTSAYEVQKVTASTDNTLAMRNMYIVLQLLPWMARKYVSYYREFIPMEIIQRVANEAMPGRIHGTYIGEYDFDADIVTQYINDTEMSATLDAMMGVMSNPTFQQSETHKTDIGELVRLYVESKKLPSDKLILPPGSPDSESNARSRINQMLLTGVYTPPIEGENMGVHLRVAKAERLRWAGLEENDDKRAKNIPLIERYIQDVQGLQEQGANQQPALGGQQVPEGIQEGIQPEGALLGGENGQQATQGSGI
jgi:hypothetical protein